MHGARLTQWMCVVLVFDTVRRHTLWVPGEERERAVLGARTPWSGVNHDVWPGVETRFAAFFGFTFKFQAPAWRNSWRHGRATSSFQPLDHCWSEASQQQLGSCRCTSSAPSLPRRVANHSTKRNLDTLKSLGDHRARCAAHSAKTVQKEPVPSRARPPPGDCNHSFHPIISKMHPMASVGESCFVLGFEGTRFDSLRLDGSYPL